MNTPSTTAPDLGINWVNMSAADRALFTALQQHRDVLKIMLAAGVFTPPIDHSSQIVLHYNQSGQLSKIDRSQILFIHKTQ